MGQLRFLVPRPERVSPDVVARAYVAGMDGVPWECRRDYSGGILAIERDVRESGNLYFPWQVAQRGELMLCTASLMERERPYHLAVELARGTLNRLRNHIDAWETGGMVIPEECRRRAHESADHLADAAISQDKPLVAAEQAEESIRAAMDGIELLSRDFCRQVLEVRGREQPLASTLLGCRLEDVPQGAAADQFASAFNTAAIVPSWRELAGNIGQYQWDKLDRQVQWCRDRGLRICMGPLLQLDRHTLPDWIYLWEEEFDELETSVIEFGRAVVQRYLGRVHLWNCAARVNVPGALDLSEEQRLRLTVDVLEMVRSFDPRTPTIVSFDQPWGEYIADQDQELTPLHFADTLVRGDLGLAGAALEINMGYYPGGTLPRDPLEVSRQIDRWTQLGVPLATYLTAPSSAADDPLAEKPARALPMLAAGQVTPQWQQEVIEWLVPLLIARQPVQAVVWNQLRDDLPHEFPHGGLYDSRGQAKPALEALAQLRKLWLS